MQQASSRALENPAIANYRFRALKVPPGVETSRRCDKASNHDWFDALATQCPSESAHGKQRPAKSGKRCSGKLLERCSADSRRSGGTGGVMATRGSNVIMFPQPT